MEGSVVLGDETAMKEGQLKEHGINNIKAIATLIEGQEVSYDF